MGTTIYSTTPFWIFLSTFGTLAFLIVLGIVGLIYAVFRTKEKKGSRIGAGCAGLFLCAVGALALGFTLLNMMTGTQTATVLLNNKRVVHENCGDNGSTCTRYVLETTAGPKSYDFTVEERAFNAAEEKGCYRVTYYPNKGLFGMLSDLPDTYIATSFVIRIEQMQAGDCK